MNQAYFQAKNSRIKTIIFATKLINQSINQSINQLCTCKMALGGTPSNHREKPNSFLEAPLLNVGEW